MLDERLEFEEYTYRLDAEGPNPCVKRLKYLTLVHDNKGGISRALTIIARHLLFEEFAQEAHREKIAKTKAALLSWLGKPNANAPEGAEYLSCWLPTYMKHVLLQEKLREFIDKKTSFPDEIKNELKETARQRETAGDLVEQIKGMKAPGKGDWKVQDGEALKKSIGTLPLRKETKATIIQSLEETECAGNPKEVFRTGQKIEAYQMASWDDDIYTLSEGNDRNKITLDRVIGNALREGPLQSYCLAVDKIQWKNVEKETKKSIKAVNKAAQDRVLKMTACCLMAITAKGATSGGESRAALINLQDLTNWSMSARVEGEDIKPFLYKKARLFLPGQASTNRSLFRINEKWIQDCDPSIIRDDPEAIEAYLLAHPEGTIYRDQGAGKPLEIDIQKR